MKAAGPHGRDGARSGSGRGGVGGGEKPTVIGVTGIGEVRGTMKSSNFQQNHHTRAFKPKPLTTAQENAIDALLTGKSDREVAEIVGVSRWSVQQWRTSNPLFMATLVQRRETLFSGAVDRLRSLLTKALDNIAKAIEDGDVTSSFALLKATGIHGLCPPTGEMDVQKIFDEQVLRLLAKEKIPGKLDDVLIKLNDNPARRQRQEEIEAELMAEFGEAG
jgi:hypothetical protein